MLISFTFLAYSDPSVSAPYMASRSRMFAKNSLKPTFIGPLLVTVSSFLFYILFARKESDNCKKVVMETTVSRFIISTVRLSYFSISTGSLISRAAGSGLNLAEVANFL